MKKDIIKTIIVCAIILFGSAFAIMSFNEDVAVETLFQKIYKLVEGKEHSGFGILEAAYGIGIALGITAFFNHFNKNKTEPTPIELKMKQYEDDIEDYLKTKREK